MNAHYLPSSGITGHGPRNPNLSRRVIAGVLIGVALLAGAWLAYRFDFSSRAFRGPQPGAPPAETATHLSELVFTIYNQPSAYHGDFWEHLDLARCATDFQALDQNGFNGVAVTIPFGSFVRRVHAGGIEIEESNRQRLIQFLSLARRFHLTTVLWLTMHRLPEGISGTLVPGYVDPAGVAHAPFVGYFPDDACVKFLGDYRWRAYLDFCRLVAQAARGFDIIFDPLDWQNFEPYSFQYGNPHLAESWRRYLTSANSDLAHWRKRWLEALATWDQVLPPVSEAMLEQMRQMKAHSEYGIRTDLKAEEAYQAYALHPMTNLTSAKWADFADWRDHLLLEMYAEITAALRSDHPGLIGQRLDVEQRYGRSRADTWGAAPNIAVLFYPLDFPLSDPERTRASIVALQKRTGKLVLLWEVTLSAPQSRQALWARAKAAAEAWHYGLGLWSWRDHYFNYHTDQDRGLRRVDGRLKPDTVAYDFVSEFFRSTVAPAAARFDTPTGKGAFVAEASCTSVSGPALYTVAPGRVTYSVPTMAPAAELQFQVALLSDVGDGAEARIFIEDAGGRSLIYQRFLRPTRPKSACQWTAEKISLDAYRGQSIRVIFEAGAGPANDLTGDWIAWAHPVITNQGAGK